MLRSLYRPAPLKAAAAALSALKPVSQERFFATVEQNTPRVMPALRGRATPVSHDRATFTIRVGLIFRSIIIDKASLISFSRTDLSSMASRLGRNRTYRVKLFSPPP